MGTLWNYFGFHQEGVCSEENSLCKTGWDAHIAPSTLKFRHGEIYDDPLAELEPKPPIQDKYEMLTISVKNQWEMQWAPSTGLSATASLWAAKKAEIQSYTWPQVLCFKWLGIKPILIGTQTTYNFRLATLPSAAEGFTNFSELGLNFALERKK